MNDTTERDCPTCWYRGPWTKCCISLTSPKRGQKVTDGSAPDCPCWKPEDWNPADDD